MTEFDWKKDIVFRNERLETGPVGSGLLGAANEGSALGNYTDHRTDINNISRGFNISSWMNMWKKEEPGAIDHTRRMGRRMDPISRVACP